MTWLMGTFWAAVPWVILGALLGATLVSKRRERLYRRRRRSTWDAGRYDRNLRKTVGDRRRPR